MAPKVEETRGWKALKALIDKSTQTEVSAKTKVPQPVLSQLLHLQRKPGRKTTMALIKAGIPGDWWDQPIRKGRAA